MFSSVTAHVYLRKYPNSGFYAERIIPVAAYVGNHVFVTDGNHAFDYHGYSPLNRLIAHHKKGWLGRFPGWDSKIERVNFSLLVTTSINARKMLGPDQYLHNPIERALQFLSRFEHDSRHI